jgi:hypothetical protein
MNDNATVSLSLRASEMETSDVSMIPTKIFRRLNASDAVMTLGTITPSP